jgi:hypothetical protein
MKLSSTFSVLFAVISWGVSVHAAPGLIRRQGDPQSSTTLDPAVIQKGPAQDGLAGSDPGTAASLTSTNNFINFCLLFTDASGKQGEITDGQQKKGGSCNPTPMGTIPSTTAMPSSKFTSPLNLQNIAIKTPFTITMAINNLQTGAFTNPKTTYFGAPQQLNKDGQIIGHSHVVIQAVNGIQDTAAADPTKFDFFLGLNSAAVGGVLKADVTDGLNAGTYRICSINKSANHVPVLVPVAHHGSLDDCIYITVGDKDNEDLKKLVGAPAGDAAAAAGANNAAAAGAPAGDAAAAATSAPAGDAAAAATSTPAGDAAAAAGANNAAAGADNAAAAGTPPASPDPSKPFLPANGQAAQKLNAQFATLTADSPCKDGDQGCINGGFAQCVGGKFQVTGCSAGTKCFALPLVNKEGTSITCDTEDDAVARIGQTGVTGGLTGSG